MTFKSDASWHLSLTYMHIQTCSDPALGQPLPESTLFVRGVQQLLEVEDEHDDAAVLVLHWNHVHPARQTGPCGERHAPPLKRPLKARGLLFASAWWPFKQPDTSSQSHSPFSLAYTNLLFQMHYARSSSDHGPITCMELPRIDCNPWELFRDEKSILKHIRGDSTWLQTCVVNSTLLFCHSSLVSTVFTKVLPWKTLLPCKILGTDDVFIVVDYYPESAESDGDRRWRSESESWTIHGQAEKERGLQNTIRQEVSPRTSDQKMLQRALQIPVESNKPLCSDNKHKVAGWLIQLRRHVVLWRWASRPKIEPRPRRYRTWPIDDCVPQDMGRFSRFQVTLTGELARDSHSSGSTQA